MMPIVAQSTPTAPTDPNVTIHVVQRGENLFRIALQYGLTVDQLARANGIISVNNLQVGQRLLIPLNAEPILNPPTTHTVQPGETIETIALFYQIDQARLIQQNGITNPNQLYIGQVLTIVPSEAVTPATIETTVTPAPPTTDTLTTSGLTHVIQRGETLFTIAQNYGVSMADLQTANNITDPSVIYFGQVLVIPGVQPVVDSVQLPEAIASLDVTPLILTEGKTGRIRLTTRSASAVTANFLNRDLPVITNGPDTYLIFAAIPLNTPEAIYPFTLTITETSGAVISYTLNLQVVLGYYGIANITLPADRAALITQSVDEAELEILRGIMGRFNPERYFDGPLSLPAAAPMNSPFGQRRSYNGGPADRSHQGADFAGAPGSPVKAAASGRIVMTDTLNIRGTSVIIDHGWGVYTNYSHLSERYVNLGDFVQTGQVIGTVGSSGRATGAHLHWELWVNGVPVDPMQWVYQAFP
ncbi:MAG: LysM peptidoglycan-binding domain-containing protein [Anaerolineae bacterium]|nr:LysM peptidoglycan-binding domain-containing protein [Anaerolineae bacterium]